MKALKAVSIALAVLVAAGLLFMLSGLFDVAADDPHWRVTERFIEAARDRSIALAARSVDPSPALDDPCSIALGARDYDEMCTGCHLAPGANETELRTGLYPNPPNLALHPLDRKPAETFWIVKHGLKFTGMPAWGLTHDDRRLWSIVAFLQKLPAMSPSAYRELVGAPTEHHHHESH